MGEVLKLLVTTESDDAFEIQVSGELDVETLEALCEIETGKNCCGCAQPWSSMLSNRQLTRRKK